MAHAHLSSYGIFSKKTLTTIFQFAAKQDSFKTYQDFFASVAMPEPILFVTPEGRGASVVDIPSKKPERGVLVYYTPMGNPLDPNQLYQIATIAATNPHYRVVGFGSPSGSPYNFPEQNLSFLDKCNIAFTSYLRPLVAADLAYLQKIGACNITIIGYSFGALRALLAWKYSASLNIRRVVFIDPVTHPRLPHILVRDFKATMEPLGMYVDRTGSQKFKQARHDTSAVLQYDQGLRRSINLAIGLMPARVNFISTLKRVVKMYSKTTVVVAWGSKSELASDERLTHLTQQYPVKGLRLKDERHAFANDFYLQAAVIQEALRLKS